MRLKSGGAKLYVYENGAAAEMRKFFKEDVARVFDKRSKDMAGYAIVAWSFDGCTSSSAHVWDGRWLGLREIPDFVKFILQENISDNS